MYPKRKGIRSLQRRFFLCLVDRQISNELYDAQNCDVVDYELVKEDLLHLMTDSQDFWPAEFGHYGGLFICLAWHCNGSYRRADGRGGCDGGRIRFNPERSWADNTNLDKALDFRRSFREQGWPLCGVFVAVAASPLTVRVVYNWAPTPEPGECRSRAPVTASARTLLGSTTMGLIYVNPEGPMGNPDPGGSVADVRDTFERMAMNDRETVALIGGGHAFGKTHGACPTGPGPDPTQDPLNPWPGKLRGFEGAWTFTPTKWGNGYFKGLTSLEWEKFDGPGGHVQWRPVPDTTPPVRMLTADIALLHDPSYHNISLEFATNQTALDEEFSHAWYKLMSRDVGPVARCRGNNVPPAQPFQNPLPPTPATLPDFGAVRSDIRSLLTTSVDGLTSDSSNDGTPYNGALCVHAAWQCASTFRITDYAGGCNGVRIRFLPEKDWPVSAGVDQIIAALEPVKESYPTLSTADLIVLAGQVALEDAGNVTIDFVGGRTDAENGNGTEILAPRQYYNTTLIAVRDNIKILGVSPYEAVALAGRPRSVAQQKILGYSGSYSNNSLTLSNEYFQILLNETWTEVSEKEFKADGKDVYMMDTDLALLAAPELKEAVQLFASEENVFKHVFSSAWARVMTADHFNSSSY
ncbi:catalase-peroxidase, putative [Phytophthora infestans T30-4]|uniref:Catalase-peroxidase, putative n=1 Tax=Phytophthora infestans (strain T30-4) TaxID=403677 RepID=D0N358_PHYIT|nr:catalase-peroxidase, putative [Phytophthora infestans T30-4]EEY69350.1 catalase-peroxidase, putative [Phytophthora infestans T30-4]|eukprot:XP_002999204.1 catalase-peroxidase, putative [Phytophthora infestans T30-4]